MVYSSDAHSCGRVILSDSRGMPSIAERAEYLKLVLEVAYWSEDKVELIPSRRSFP